MPIESKSPDYGALLKQSFRKLEELQGRIRELEREHAEPIAVIGLALPFSRRGERSGGSSGSCCRNGVDAVTRIPADRWDADAFYDPDPGAAGQDVHAGGRLSRRRGSVRPAILRHLTARSVADGSAAAAAARGELGRRSSTRASAPATLAGSRTGVFVGICSSRLHACCRRDGASRAGIDTYSGRGRRAQHRLRPPLVPPRRARAQRLRRHGLLVVARGHAPGLSEPAHAANPTWRWPAAST